jgi:predicted short-subunit dehydrogenase-like oxidoreductase (DUF2520 family)
MRLVLIGSGNVATVLGIRFKDAGHDILQVLSRNIQHARSLAQKLDSIAIDSPVSVTKDADVYIVCVSDDQLYDLDLRLDPGLVVHTAGSVPLSVLDAVSTNTGVFYPLQTIRKEIPQTQHIPLLIDARTETARNTLFTLARSISENVQMADDSVRRKLHLAAVIVNNFSNYLFTLTEEFCRKEHIDFQMLLPLIREGADRLNNHSPADVQTGPASRGDHNTIGKHRELLAAHQDLLRLYDFFTDSMLHK